MNIYLKNALKLQKFEIREKDIKILISKYKITTPNNMLDDKLEKELGRNEPFLQNSSKKEIPSSTEKQDDEQPKKI